jgi:hypothetical protein
MPFTGIALWNKTLGDRPYQNSWAGGKQVKVLWYKDFGRVMAQGCAMPLSDANLVGFGEHVLLFAFLPVCNFAMSSSWLLSNTSSLELFASFL